MIDLWNERGGDELLMLSVSVLAQSTVLAALALAAARLLRRSATVRHCIVLSILLSLMIIPLLTFALAKTGIQVLSIPLASRSANDAKPTMVLQPEDRPMAAAAESAEEVINRDAAGEEPAIESEVAALPTLVRSPAAADSRGGEDSVLRRCSQIQFAASAVTAVWLLGMFVTLCGIARSAWRLRRIIRRARPFRPKNQSDVMEQVCRILGIESMSPIVCSADVNGPTVAGAIRPLIILPAKAVSSLSDDELRDILLHEMAHVLRRDPLVVLLQQTAAVLYWLNPLVHLLNRELARAREEICDNYVLSAVEPADYGETLLHVGQLLPRPRLVAASVGMFNTNWKLEDRIANLLDERRSAVIRLQPILTVAIVLSAFTLSLAVAGSRFGLAQVSSPSAAAAKVEAESDAVSRAVQRTIESLSQRPATPTPQQEWLALYAIEIAAGKVTLVASEPRGNLTYIGTPSWSADGQRILFDATPGKDWRRTRLMMIDMTGSAATAKDLGAGNCPAMSPDGDHIAFLLNSGAVADAPGGVWLMDSDGANRRRLGGFGIPKWSPDGGKLLIVGFSRPLPLAVMDVETKEERTVELAGHRIWSVPSWAGDSNTLVAVVTSAKGAGIALVDIADPEQAKVKQILWRQGDRLDASPAYPVYSPETGRCVFVGREEKGMALYSLFTNQYDPPQRLEADGYDNKIASLALSPDGRYVLFCSDRPDALQRTAASKEEKEGSDQSLLEGRRGRLSEMVAMFSGASLRQRRVKSTNNMKMLGLALHNFHDTYQRFPAHANYSDDGKPLLSWRVHILPYVDQAALYGQFHLDEPWDSSHNRQLISQMPPVFQSPLHPDLSKEGKTTYLAIHGKSLAFEGADGVRISDFIDGASNTIMAVEAAPAEAAVWTKPSDLQVDLDSPTKGLLDPKSEGFNVLFSDGSVRHMPNSIDPQQLRAMLTRSGGEPIR